MCVVYGDEPPFFSVRFFESVSAAHPPSSLVPNLNPHVEPGDVVQLDWQQTGGAIKSIEDD